MSRRKPGCRHYHLWKVYRPVDRTPSLDFRMCARCLAVEWVFDRVPSRNVTRDSTKGRRVW